MATSFPARPLVIAHRGGLFSGPEHTLDAYKQSLALGVDGWECDVRLTRDGHLVCLHDRRVDNVSNGRGAVSRHSLEELQRLQYSSRVLEKRKGRQESTGNHSETGNLLILEDLLSFFVEAAPDKRLLIETKHPVLRGHEVEERLASLLRRFKLDTAHNVAVMSFWPPALGRVKRFLPSMRTVQLWGSIPPFFPPGSTPAVGPAVRVLRTFPGYVRRARREGREVITWTVNTSAELDFLRDLGVDVIVTDYPQKILKELDESSL